MTQDHDPKEARCAPATAPTAALREDIIEWRLPPGTVLGEVEQAERLGVSRTPLREALGRLTAEGLTRTAGGRGVVVTDISLEHIDELFELRETLWSVRPRPWPPPAANRQVSASCSSEFLPPPTLIARLRAESAGILRAGRPAGCCRGPCRHVQLVLAPGHAQPARPPGAGPAAGRGRLRPG